MNVVAPIRLIDLAREPAFRLGSVEILPPTCEAVWPGGREALQPRIMKVLVALNERRGAVLSHGDLILACWEGRIVGEDAIQRCIARLRLLGKQTGGFTIDTIPRIGYRLNAAGQPASAIATAQPPRGHATRITLVLLLAALAAAGVGAAWLLRGQSRPGRYERVDVRPIEAFGGGRARTLATALQGDIFDVLTQSRIPVTGKHSMDGLVLHGAVTQSGSRLTIHFTLSDGPSGTPIWSRRFERPASDDDRLATEASVAVARNIESVREADLQPGFRPDPELVAMYARGDELVRSPQFLEEGAPREIFERVVERAPGFALGHSMLSLAYANEARRAAPEGRAAWYAKARAEAAKAIAIHPESAGAAYDTRYLAARTERPRDLVAAEQLLADGLRHAPRFAFLSMRQCRFLTEVGRAGEALPYCQRALALAPFGEPIGHTYARALYAAGMTDKATEAIERAARLAPDHGMTRMARLQVAAFGGDPARARKLIDDSATRPSSLSERGREVLSRYLARPGVRERRALAEDIVSAAAEDPMFADTAVLMLTSMGRNDLAFEVLRSPALDRLLFTTGTGFLFTPAAAFLRKDSRFWRAAADLGLARYWATTGKWPDMCGREFTLAYCEAAAAKASAA